MNAMRLSVTNVCRILALTVAAWSPPKSHAAATQTLIVPANAANTLVAFGAGPLTAANYRIQEVYGAQNFTVTDTLHITELRYRPDTTYGRAFNTIVGNIEIRLSTTTLAPDGLSQNYAQNPGSDETLVHSGSLEISSQFIGPPGEPKNFDIIIPLQTPFFYNPAAGNLLVDIRNFTGSSASLLGGLGDISTDWSSRLGGALGNATGSPDSAVTPLQIVYLGTNGPPVPPAPTSLLRGPYLQRGTMTNILVCWRTSRMTNGIVNFGLSPGALTWQATGFSPTNNHYVLLTNLAPNTKYYYSIGATGTNFAGGADFFFLSAPAGPKPTRVWVIGDPGTAATGSGNQVGVRNAYYAHAGSRYTDVWLALGDNAYYNGTDREYQLGFFDIYPNLLQQTPLWSAIGNHETYAAPVGQRFPYLDIFEFPQEGQAGGVPSGTERYYSFDYGNIHFVCIDSMTSQRTTGAMLNWLEADLAANTKDWTIAYFHHPPYTKGSHNSDAEIEHIEMRQHVTPLLESYGVDLVLGGHSHIYERSFLLHGHYGLSTTLTPAMVKNSGSGRPSQGGAYVKTVTGPDAGEGTVYVVAGSSGWATFRTGVHPVMFYDALQMGSLVLDIDGRRLDAAFLRETGAIEDTFTILKQTVPQALRVTRIDVVNGIVTLHFSTTPGKTYRIERTFNLGPATWAPVGADLLATGSTTIWSGPVSPNADKAFYQAVELSN